MTEAVIMTPAEDLPPEIVVQVLLLDGEIFQLGASVPGTDAVGAEGPEGQLIPELVGKQAIKVIGMFHFNGGIEVFGSPVPGSRNDQEKKGWILSLPGHTIKRVVTMARFDTFNALLQEAREGYPDDEEEPDEPPSLNGAAHP
jgi:hypothetical protein